MMILNPAFVAQVRRQNLLIQEGDHSEPRSPDNTQLMRIWEQECPTMFRLLSEAGILMQYANVLNETALQQANEMPGDARENLSQVRMEMIPCYPEQEANWLRNVLEEADLEKLGLMPYEDEVGRLIVPNKVPTDQTIGSPILSPS
ncbi:hypothetical protein [Prosthecobacter sp.]|uniref:hypothetical protein n=1 Tax=Prosthecobacter sp. TaxID=1965333 RepID=UPI003783A86A